ncbi:hypothetical protein Tco_1264428 [Tanacetum coccineum]
MDTLSLVSKYLNGMEDILDDEDSMEAKKLTVEKNKEELELFEALDHKSVIVNEGSHRVVVFKKAPLRAYNKLFTRFSLPCDVDYHGAWDAKLDMADSFNYITEERFDQLVIGYVNEGEPSVLFGRDFLVTSKSRVDFGIGNMHIDLTMLEEMKKIDVMLDALVENLEEEIPTISTIAPPSPVYHPLTQKQEEKVKEALDRKYKELEEPKPILEVLENYMTYRKKLDEVLMGRARLNSDDYGEEVKMRIAEHGLPKKMYIPVDKELPLLLGHLFLRTCGAVIDMGRVGRDEDGNPKYGPVAPSFLDIKDDMERALAMEAYFNPFKNIIVFKKLIDFLGAPIKHKEDLETIRKCRKHPETTKKPTGVADSDEMPADRLEVCVRQLEKAMQGSSPNPLIANFEKKNKHGTIEYHLQQVKNANLKWRELSSAERHAYCERLFKLQEHLCKHALGLKENSLICGGHYVTKIAHSLGYLNNKEVAKCSKPIECETWIARMLENELDEGIHSLIQTEQEVPQPGQTRRQSQKPRGLDSSSIVPSSGYEIGGRQQDFIEMNLIRLVDMREDSKDSLVSTVCERQENWKCVLTRLIDDLLALDSIVRLGSSDQRLELTATFSISTDSE